MAKKAAPKAAEPKAAARRRREGGHQARDQDRVYGTLAEKTGLSKKQVASVFEAFQELHGKELGKKGPGNSSCPACTRSRSSTSRPPRLVPGSTLRPSSRS